MAKSCTDACCFLALLLVAAGLLVFAFAIVVPVHVSVDEATLGRLALAGNNRTSLAYDVALAVAVYNGNWAMHVRTTAPLDAEPRFAGRPLARVRLAGAADWYWIHPLRTAVYRFTAAGVAALGSNGAAELARESAAGVVFQMELVVSGEFRYQAHSDRHRIRVTCPLKLGLSTATVTTPFVSVECT